MREDLGLVSFPETVERFLPAHFDDPLAPQKAARAIFQVDFSSHLRPVGQELFEWARRYATTLIFSNGDQFFQRWKTWNSGLAEASAHRVLGPFLA